MTYHPMNPQQERRIEREAGSNRTMRWLALAFGALFVVTVIFVFMSTDRGAVVSQDGPPATIGQGGAASKMPAGKPAP
jgi:hypothetical protein